MPLNLVYKSNFWRTSLQYVKIIDVGEYEYFLELHIK